MNALLVILLAQRSRGDSLSESFRNHAGSGRDEVLLGLLIAAALVAGLWAVARLTGMRRRRRGYRNPGELFRALCKAHHLTWSDRWLLGRVARHQGLRDPARLFLEAERWEEQNLGSGFALEFARLRTLRNRILGPPASARGEPPVRRTEAASPLLPRMPVPTFDLPPGSEPQHVES